MFQRLPSPLPSPAWRARESPDRIKQLELVERLDPLEHSLALPRQAALEAFIKSPVPRFLVIRQLVEQKNVVVGAVAGADTPLGVDALTARHGQIVFLPAVVIVAHQLKIIFQRDRRLIVLRDQVGTRLAAPLLKRGMMPWLIMKSTPSDVDFTASLTVSKPYGFAISTPPTKFGRTLPSPKTSTSSIRLLTQPSQPTRRFFPGLIHSNNRLSQTSMFE